MNEPLPPWPPTDPADPSGDDAPAPPSPTPGAPSTPAATAPADEGWAPGPGTAPDAGGASGPAPAGSGWATGPTVPSGAGWASGSGAPPGAGPPPWTPPGAGWGPPPWIAWAPPPPRRSAWPIVLAGLGGLVVGGVLTVVVLIALAALSFSEAGEWLDDQLSEEYDSTSVAADAVRGECFLRQDLTGTESPVVDCSEAHGAEVYARRPALEGENLPYPTELDSLGDGICLGEFEPYVSRSYFDSSLGYVTLVPSQEAWNRGERDIVCSLFALGGDELVGTSKGSGR